MRSRLFCVALPVLVALAACGGGPSSQTLTMAQVQALNPGIRAAWLLAEYPAAQVVAQWPDGKPRRVTYPVTDPAGRSQSLTLDIDTRGIVVGKHYSGRVLRPPSTGK